MNCRLSDAVATSSTVIAAIQRFWLIAAVGADDAVLEPDTTEGLEDEVEVIIGVCRHVGRAHERLTSRYGWRYDGVNEDAFVQQVAPEPEGGHEVADHDREDRRLAGAV